jgi:hypothetical protein
MLGKNTMLYNLHNSQMICSAILGFNLTLDSGDIRVIKIDGGNDILSSDPVESVGILYPGERMDIITSGGGKSLTMTLDPEYASS